ncbi:hypothetical protein EDC04DRAFT_687464 [Pisolithus marmoratus]|nr:hypothetical protein EDC04DRAFT_687464 [Pisolithus marmoratus]
MMINWLKSSFSEKYYSGVLFAHSLDSNPTADSTLVARHLEAFANTLPNRFTVPSRVHVVPTRKPDSVPSEVPRQRLSQLESIVRTLKGNRSRKWHVSVFPEVFEGQPEIAWSAALLLLKDMTETQANEFFTFPRPTLKRMPVRLPDAHLALKGLSDFLLREFGYNRSGASSALITLARTALEFTPQGHPHYHSALINFANVLYERFKKEDTNLNLDEVIALRRTVWKRMFPDDPERQSILLELDNCLNERFRRGDAIADLEEIISLRRAALEHTSSSNRCRQLLNLANSLVEKYEKLGLVTDIKEAIDLGRTALEFCPPGHPDHALSKDCLANYLDAKIKKRCVRPLGAGKNPSSPSTPDIKQFIRKIVFQTLETMPLRLLHTPTGDLCNRELLLSHFERSPQYQQLLSLTQPSAAAVRDAVNEFFQFATLSHRWASGEPLLRDVEGRCIYDMDGGEGLEKLQRFCALTLRRGFLWAWSDTCCIDKDSSAELQEAIGSMFSWYHSSSLTLVHLCDVSDTGSLADSVWFERGWTLQELLASRAVLFYTQDWSLYKNLEATNHKTDPALLEEVGKAAGIAKQHLMDFYPGLDDARSRLHWASRRRTTRPEDIAYSLFGIFGVHLPIIYGESAEHALGRLLAEIISGSGDVSVLDWVGKASPFNSCFPANLAPYQPVPHVQVIASDPAKRNGLDLEKARKLYNDLAGLALARCANRRLSLPSIIHPVTEIRLQGSSASPSRYTYEIHATRLTSLEITLSANLDEAAGRYILVRPWHPKALPTQTGSESDTMWELLEQLKQPFNALLLKKLPHNEYKRIVSDCTITICPEDLSSVLDSQVLTLEVV